MRYNSTRQQMLLGTKWRWFSNDESSGLVTEKESVASSRCRDAFCVLHLFFSSGIIRAGFPGQSIQYGLPTQIQSSVCLLPAFKNFARCEFRSCQQNLSIWMTCLFREPADNAVVTLVHHKGIHSELISAEDNLTVALLIKCPNRLFPH